MRATQAALIEPTMDSKRQAVRPEDACRPVTARTVTAVSPLGKLGYPTAQGADANVAVIQLWAMWR